MVAYCDYIGALIREKLVGDTASIQSVIKDVSHVQMDLHPEEGYFVSTKKTIEVIDINRKRYKVTVEEL